MGFNDGEIILEPEAGPFYAGQNFRGKFRFQQDEEIICGGIYVEVVGYARVNWIRHISRRRDSFFSSRHNGIHHNTSPTVNHFAYEDFFKKKEYLVGRSEGEYHLQPGVHELQFECEIPASCPSSFVGYFGLVEYRVKIVVDKSLILNQQKERVITVIAPLDWKNTPQYRIPMNLELETTYSSWCTSVGSCVAIVKAPRSSYRVGQSVPIELTCANSSSVVVNNIVLQIVKKTTFIATFSSGVKFYEEKILEISEDSVPGHTTRNWELEMEIPIVDPCNLAGCSIINVIFNFVVKLKPAGCHLVSEQSRQIVIGDTPDDDDDL